MLLMALTALPGLLVRPGVWVVHEHDGGSDPHNDHGSALIGHVDHTHPHEHDVTESESAAGEDPSDENGDPEDGDRHGHFPGAHPVTASRANIGGQGGAERVPGRDLPRAQAFERPERTEFDLSPAPGDSRGFPPSRTGRAVDRLVQGLGLLI